MVEQRTENPCVPGSIPGDTTKSKILYIKEKLKLNSYLSKSGISSRRNADNLIKSGKIKVNGKIIKKLGYIISNNDIVKYQYKRLYPEKKIYLILNKPKGYVSSMKKQDNNNIVLDLIKINYKIFSIGRLDIETSGVLLFTNDGYLSNKLTHPKFNIKKIYHVVLNKTINKKDLLKIKNSFSFKEGKIKIYNISYIKKLHKNNIKLELHIGWNKIVKRIFNKIKYKVLSLKRINFGGITIKGLKIGEYRYLTKYEIFLLKNL